MKQTFSKLKEMSIGKTPSGLELKKYVFELKHNNTRTTLEQNLVIEVIDDFYYKPSIQMEGFPDVQDPDPVKALEILATWMARMSETILQEKENMLSIKI